jgi:hypothetical protein
VNQVLRFSHTQELNQVQGVLHTQEGEPGARVFVAIYYGFPILKAAHIGPLSLLLYDCLIRFLKEKHQMLFLTFLIPMFPLHTLVPRGIQNKMT